VDDTFGGNAALVRGILDLVLAGTLPEEVARAYYATSDGGASTAWIKNGRYAEEVMSLPKRQLGEAAVWSQEGSYGSWTGDPHWRFIW
jgi:hypothetical protein